MVRTEKLKWWGFVFLAGKLTSNDDERMTRKNYVSFKSSYCVRYFVLENGGREERNEISTEDLSMGSSSHRKRSHTRTRAS